MIEIPEGMEKEFCIVARNCKDLIQRCVYVDHRKQQYCRDGCPVAKLLRPDAKYPDGTGGGPLKVGWLK